MAVRRVGRTLGVPWPVPILPFTAVIGSYERLKEAAPPPVIITSDTAWPS